MSSSWGVFSEVGRLRAVLVHQPGYEHRRTVPWNKDALLFDDILDVEEARPEHKRFTSLLSDSGAEVLYFEDLLKDVCASRGELEEVCTEVLGQSVAGAIVGPAFQPEHLIRGYPERYSLSASLQLAPLPNLYFTRDPAFAVPGAIVIAHPAKRARQREARLVGAVLRRHPMFADAVIYGGLLDDPAGSVEGGDVHVVDERTVVVGVGERTNDAGAEHLARFLFGRCGVERVLKVFIPARREFMHLDTVLTFIDRRRILTMPFLWGDHDIYASIARASRKECDDLGVSYSGPDPDRMADQTCGVEVVHKDGSRQRHDDALQGLAEQGVIDRSLTVYVAENERYESPAEHVVEALREQWNDAANALALKPGQVVGYGRNDRTCRALEERGVEVLALEGGELVRGRGGARCMTMPLRRDPA